MKNTMSWDEIQLLQYDVMRLHNTLKGLEDRIDNHKVKNSIQSTLIELEELNHLVRTQDILE